MKISDLVKELDSILEAHGDLNVRINCDHGQELMSATYTGVSYVENDNEYMPEYSDDPESFDDGVAVVEIQAF